MSSVDQSHLERSNQDSDEINMLQESASSNTPSEGPQLHQSDPGDYKGDLIQAKENRIIRICQININGVTHTAKNPKNLQIRDTINTYEFDHTG